MGWLSLSTEDYKGEARHTMTLPGPGNTLSPCTLDLELSPAPHLVHQGLVVLFVISLHLSTLLKSSHVSMPPVSGQECWLIH